MKTVTVTPAQAELHRLVEEAYSGSPVLLSAGDMTVKLERYVPAAGEADLNLEEDTPELEAELLKAVNGPFTPYSRQDLEAVAERVRREKSGR
jgi:hypothetical protein